MTTTEALTLLARDLYIDWQKQPALYTTQRGREKPVVSGFPGKVFWRRYGQPDVKLAMKQCGAWLKRHGKGKWEILVALNHDRAALLTELWEVPIALPDAAPKDATPF